MDPMPCGVTEGEGMLLLSKEDIKKVFTMKEAIEADKIAYRLAVEGKADIPLRTVIAAPKYEANFLFMPAYVEELDAAAVKNVNIFPKNAEAGLPTAPAQVLLIDGKTGLIVSILDGTYITQLRTGAASGAAFDLLAKKDCKIGALIGVGGQAECQLEAMLAARDLEEVRVYSRNSQKTEEFAGKMQEALKGYGAKIVAAKSSDEAIDNADLIITATSSTQPVFDGGKVKKGATISCIGSYQHHMQELDPVALTRASKIYFDSREAVLSEAGDITIPLKEGTISEKDFTGDLGDVVRGKLVGRENDEEIIIFKSVGIAVQDLVTAKMVYDKAKEARVGTFWG